MEADAHSLIGEAEKRRFRSIRAFACSPGNRHMVAYLGEDWAALTASDVGITWKSSMSYGAYGAAALRHSPLVQHAHIATTSQSDRDTNRAPCLPRQCSVAVSAAQAAA